MYIAQITVTYKPSILDPQGEVIKDALGRLDYQGGTSVTQGKYFEIKLTATDEQSAYDEATSLTEALLINPNTETYRITTLAEVEA